MFPIPMTNFPPQEVLQSMDSGETYPIEWWWNNYVLTGNPDGTYTANTKFSNGIPPMTLRRIESPPRPFLGLEDTVLYRGEADGKIKIGCGDKHSTNYNTEVEIHDNDKCGSCVQGYTRTSELHCFKVGWRLVDCKTGDIYYAPAGYEQVDGEWQKTLDYYQNHGRDVLATRSNYKNSNTKTYINSSRTEIKIRPKKGSPINIAETGYWANHPRTIKAVKNDGTLMVKSGQGSKTNWPGADYDVLIKKLKDSGCEGKWVQLGPDDRAKVPTFLGGGAGLGQTSVILLDDIEDDETEIPVTDPLQGGPTEPEKTNWTPIALIAAGVIALPILLGGRK